MFANIAQQTDFTFNSKFTARLHKISNYEHD